jgi:integrase
MRQPAKIEAPEKVREANRKPRSLPAQLWPEADRIAWAAACRPGTRLKRGGAASHVKPVTRDDHALHYGNFLGFLDRSGWLQLDGQAASSVTPENVNAHVTELQQRVSSVTVHGSICRLRRVAKFIAPDRDFAWLLEIAKDLALVARPRSKFDRLVSSELLVEAGLTLMHEAETVPNKTKLARATQFRNGLMVALLAVCPIRRKNFAALEVGRSFVETKGTWWIILSASETKERRADERPVPAFLSPFINRYLEKHRPTLARSGTAPSALWLSALDGTPITAKQLARLIRTTTLSTVGVAVGPHLFRTSAASTAASCAGDNPHLASALLHHAHPSVTNDYYNRATSMTAAEYFGRIIRQYVRSD